MIQDSERQTMSQEPPSSSSPNQQLQQQQQQPRLFNRMSGFLFQKRQGSFTQEDYGEPSSSAASGMVTSSIHGGEDGAPSYYSGINEDSRVDSVFSSLQSNQSNMRVNPNTSTPGRTVRLNGGIIHRQNGAPPSLQHDIPPPTAHEPAATTTDTNANLTTSSAALSATTASIDDNVIDASAIGFDKAFEKMAHEYGLPENVAKTLSPEAKQVLLRNSQGNFKQHQSNHGNNTNDNNGFFSWRTWGIQKKQKHSTNVFHDDFFDPSSSSTNAASTSAGDPSSSRKNNKRGHNGNSINNNRKKAYSTSARNRTQRASIMDFTQDTNSNNDHKQPSNRYDRTTKKVLSPEYFIHLLKDCHVRDLDESQVQNLRVCLRSVKASWTTQFLKLDGYYVISNLFRQMNQAPKRSPNDDKILQHLAKCFKAIMTHEQAGTAIVLTNPVGLTHIRDLLFGPVNQHQRSLYSLSVTTRAHFMNVLCTLANLQTTPSENVPYIHGYDVLRHLLLDETEQHTITKSLGDGNTNMTASSNDQDDLTNNISNNTSNFPFRMTLKEDPQTIMKIILENDPFYCPGQPLVPRYTAWMRELQYTVEKEIEPITFLAQVLDYKFESAFRQLRIKSPTQQQQQQGTVDDQPLEPKDTLDEEGTCSVMVNDGVVEYLIAHLRLINTIVATQPTFCTGTYDDRDREKVRLEIMMSGFDKIAKALQSCPHPTLYGFYFIYLQPILQPRADIHANNNHERSTPIALDNTASHLTYPSNDDVLQWQNDTKQFDGSGILFEQPPWVDDSFYDDDDDFEDYDSNDDDQDMDMDTLDDDDGSDEYDLGMGSSQEPGRQWKMSPAMSR